MSPVYQPRGDCEMENHDELIQQAVKVCNSLMVVNAALLAIYLNLTEQGEEDEATNVALAIDKMKRASERTGSIMRSFITSAARDRAG